MEKVNYVPGAPHGRLLVLTLSALFRGECPGRCGLKVLTVPHRLRVMVVGCHSTVTKENKRFKGLLCALTELLPGPGWDCFLHLSLQENKTHYKY